jgi:hypothetical protein
MRRSLAQRQRERAAAHAAQRSNVAPAPAPVKEVVEEEEDAAELEYLITFSRLGCAIRLSCWR